MLISLMALSPQRKLHSGLSGQIKLAIYGLLSLALTMKLAKGLYLLQEQPMHFKIQKIDTVIPWAFYTISR
ncbi:hypothetical protein [Candidatus Regiella endosymbiont of Tuberolachnus salignus]|uniref:hypothetical protein n=1 Tax=Candidatus Regiella endosymbiont of Tuberolachnus salignus TaxID=3077956 RepID=UPI0030CE7957